MVELSLGILMLHFIWQYQPQKSDFINRQTKNSFKMLMYLLCWYLCYVVKNNIFILIPSMRQFSLSVEHFHTPNCQWNTSYPKCIASWLSTSHSPFLSVSTKLAQSPVALLRHYVTLCKSSSFSLLIIIIIVMISIVLPSLLSRYNWSFIVTFVIFIHQYHCYYSLMSPAKFPPTSLFKLVSLNFTVAVFVRAPKCFSLYMHFNRSFTCLFFSFIDYLKPHPSLYHIMTAT